MKHAIWYAALLPALLAGCAAPGRNAAVNLTPTAVASSTTCMQRPIEQVRLDGEDFFGDLLDSQFCQIPKDNAQFRLFRTQLLITMLAHYGQERFRDFSSQPTTDAYKLLQRIRSAEMLVDTMRTASDQTDIFYSVQRVNLEMGIINIASTELQPVPAQGNVVSVGSTADQINKSKQLFASTVKDNLYLGAYREVLGGAIKQVAPNGTLNESVPPSHTAWRQTLTNLNEYCSRLSAMAGTQIDCLTSGLRQWGGLQSKSAANL